MPEHSEYTGDVCLPVLETQDKDEILCSSLNSSNLSSSSGYGDSGGDSANSSLPSKRSTSTPVETSSDNIQVVSFRDSVLLGGDSERSQESDQTPEQPAAYDWFGLPAPMQGTMVPNRIFVGGISPQTTESDLAEVFSPFGNVRGTKIILDRAGISKGYGFVTFESELEAMALCQRVVNKELGPIIVRERRLNIAPAIKKQPPRSEVGYPPPPPSPPPYLTVSYYMSQGNAAQYYYQPVPLGDQFYPYPQDISPYGPISQAFYNQPPIQMPNPVYCYPEPEHYMPGQGPSGIPIQIIQAPSQAMMAQVPSYRPPPPPPSQPNQFPTNIHPRGGGPGSFTSNPPNHELPIPQGQWQAPAPNYYPYDNFDPPPNPGCFPSYM